jgi:hypothetical protein
MLRLGSLGTTSNTGRPGTSGYKPRNSAQHASEDEEYQPDVPAEGSYIPFV